MPIALRLLADRVGSWAGLPRLRSRRPVAPLTLEQVTSRPSVIGTPPGSPAWSPDSRRLVFAWNDQGMPFRDLWIVASDGSGRRQLTDLARTHPSPPPPAGRSHCRARGASRSPRDARGSASTCGCATPDSALHRCRCDLSAWTPMAARPRALTLAARPRTWRCRPMERRLAFLRDGDLWIWPVDASAPPARLTQVAVPGIARVSLGTYNRADVEVGTGIWGASWSPFAWAPDGRTIALHQVDRRHIRRVPFPSYLGDETIANELRRGYPGDENERRTLHLLDVATRALRPIALDEPGYRAVSDFEWAADGRLLIDRVSDTGTDRWLSVLDPGTTVPRLVWHDQRATRIYPSYAARWHPDGRRIVVLADLVERDHLYAIDASGPAVQPVALTSGAWDVDFAHSHCRRWHVYLYQHTEEPVRTAGVSRIARWRCAGGLDHPGGNPRAGDVARRPPSCLDLDRRCDAAGAGGLRDGWWWWRTPCHQLAAARVLAAPVGAPAIRDFHECRRRLCDPRPHPRAAGPRPHPPASRDLRAGVFEYCSQPLERPCRYAPAVPRPAGLHRRASGRSWQRRLRPRVPRGISHGLWRKGS